MKKIWTFSILGLVLILSNCGDDNPLAYDDNTTTRGETTFYVEQNVEPLIETSIEAFEGFRPNAKINAIYEKEVDVINSFIDKKTNAIIISRDFTKEERKEFLDARVGFRSFKYIIGANALIVPKTEDSTYTENEFLDLLTTTDPTKPKIIFDAVQSANFNYFQDRIAPKKFGPNVKCVKTNLEVMDYVKSHEHCIGVIGFNWISDYDDPEVRKRCENFKIVTVAKGNGKHFVPPFNYYVYEKQYPFTQFWYIHNKSGKADLEAGFANYLVNEKGQLIAKKSGIQPYFKIQREFKIVVE